MCIATPRARALYAASIQANDFVDTAHATVSTDDVDAVSPAVVGLPVIIGRVQSPIQTSPASPCPLRPLVPVSSY